MMFSSPLLMHPSRNEGARCRSFPFLRLGVHARLRAAESCCYFRPDMTPIATRSPTNPFAPELGPEPVVVESTAELVYYAGVLESRKAFATHVFRKGDAAI